MKHFRSEALVLCAALLLAGAAEKTKFGLVRVQGKIPKPATKAIHLDKEACGKAHKDESLLVGSKGVLANAVVTWGGAKPGLISGAPATLIQRGCSYDPHIVVLRPGQPLVIVNADPILHTTGFTAKRNRVKTAAQPRGAEAVTVTFVRPEAVRLYCDVHAWMDGWVYVTEAPNFFITGKDGKFPLAGLAAGTKLSVWHEKLGLREAEAGEAGLDVVYSIP